MDSYEKMGEVDTLDLRNGLMKMAYSDKREPFFGIKVPFCMFLVVKID